MGDAGHFSQLVGVGPRGRAAADRRAHEGRIRHSRHARIDAVLRRAGGLRRHVDARDALAEQTVVARLLQVLRGVDRRRGRRRRGERSDLAIAHFAAARLVHHGAGLGDALGGGHAPLGSGGIDQHPARLRTGHAHRRPVAERRDARDDVLRLEDRMVIGGIDRRLLDLHLAPVGVQLLRHDQRQPGRDALPHLGHRLLDGDGAVGRDRDVGVQPARGGLRFGSLGKSNRNPEHQSCTAAHERTAADLEFEQLEVVHG